jgi:hypothetical protein
MGYIENCHKAPTFLEKDGESKKFTSQSEVDQAWADGWYAPGRPESCEKQKKTNIPECASDLVLRKPKKTKKGKK